MHMKENTIKRLAAKTQWQETKLVEKQCRVDFSCALVLKKNNKKNQTFWHLCFIQLTVAQNWWLWIIVRLGQPYNNITRCCRVQPLSRCCVSMCYIFYFLSWLIHSLSHRLFDLDKRISALSCYQASWKGKINHIKVKTPAVVVLNGTTLLDAFQPVAFTGVRDILTHHSIYTVYGINSKYCMVYGRTVGMSCVSKKARAHIHGVLPCT